MYNTRMSRFAFLLSLAVMANAAAAPVDIDTAAQLYQAAAIREQVRASLGSMPGAIAPRRAADCSRCRESGRGPPSMWRCARYATPTPSCRAIWACVTRSKGSARTESPLPPSDLRSAGGPTAHMPCSTCGPRCIHPRKRPQERISPHKTDLPHEPADLHNNR